MTDMTHDGHEATQPALQPQDAVPAQLSAFMDNELPSAEGDLLVRRLERDGELKHTMSRYLLIGEALRQATPAATKLNISRDFSARVAAAVAIDTTAVPALPKTARFAVRTLWKNMAGVAVAASVAVAAVMVVRQPPQADLQQAQALPESANDSYIVPSVATVPAAPIPAARLTNYVVAHSEFSSPLGRQNLMTGLLSEERPSDMVVALDASSSSRSAQQ